MEKYDNTFHLRYVGATDGEIAERTIPMPGREIVGMSYEEVLKQYRVYVNDPEAELPEEVIKQLELSGKFPA